MVKGAVPGTTVSDIVGEWLPAPPSLLLCSFAAVNCRRCEERPHVSAALLESTRKARRSISPPQPYVNVVIPSADSMILWLTAVHENSYLELTLLFSITASAIRMTARNLVLSPCRSE